MKFSILDLVTLRQGQSHADAIHDMTDLAKLAEKLGYHRFWISEHHNMKYNASSATHLLIQRALDQTQHIRVGSGGVMLPNHSPYIVAEQYGTLESLYPNRLDLGLGRAPGTDMQTARAIRRTNQVYPEFESDLKELKGYFDDTNTVSAYPAAGLNIPFYILGSSKDSAYLAAKLGLPYVFASHFAPALMSEAVAIYRRQFQPSSVLDKPYVMLAANVIIADSNDQAQQLFTSLLNLFLTIITGEASPLLPPVNSVKDVWKNYISTTKVPHFGPVAFEMEQLIHREKEIIERMSSVSFIGDKEKVKQEIKAFYDEMQFDELIVTSYIYEKEKQHHSYKLLAEIKNELFT